MKEWTSITSTECAAACFAHAGPSSARVLLSGAPGAGTAAAPSNGGVQGGTADVGSAVVVGVRGSTDRHIAEAGRRAVATRAKLVLVHADRSVAERDRLRVERDLAGATSALRSAGVQATYELRSGRPATVLAQVAREVDADLLIIGSAPLRRGRRGIGRTGRSLGRHAPCPVVLVAGPPPGP